MNTVATLPDYLLLSQTRQLARHEQALQILVLDHLCEIQARQLYLTRGYGSLFDYVVRELGYTAAAAWRRIKAMRLSTQIGVAGELLRDGSLALSNAAQLQNLFERSDRNHGHPPGVHGAGGGPGGAPRSDGAPGNPASAAPMRGGERGPAPGGGPVLDAATREKLVKQAAGKSTREVQQMLAEVDPELAQPSDRVRALGNGRWELKATVGADCRHGLEKLQMLLSHKDPHLTLGALVAHLVQDGLKRYDPAHPRRLRRTGGPASSNGGQSTHTPSAGGVQRAAASAAKRPVEAVHGQMAPATVRDSGGGHGTSAAKRSEPAVGSKPAAAHRAQDRSVDTGMPGTSHAHGRNSGSNTASAAKRREHAVGAKDAAACSHQDRVADTPSRRSDSVPLNASHANGRNGGNQDSNRALAAEERNVDDRMASRRRSVGRDLSTSSAGGHDFRGGAVPARRLSAVERHFAAMECLAAMPGSRSRYIPAAVRREVWRRDGGRCSYVDCDSGRRCGSRYRLEIDHIVPFALGGGAVPGNLRIRCNAHHRYRHAQRDAHSARLQEDRGALAPRTAAR